MPDEQPADDTAPATSRSQLQDDLLTIHVGDCLAVLRGLPSGSVRMCVCSPPYWGLRDYGCEGQIGLERTPEEYVAKMVEVFREVRRVLTDDGTLWLNLGDSYANDGKWGGSTGGKHVTALHGASNVGRRQERGCSGLKPKDLVGIPWRVAFALRADGWWLREDIIWHKPNPMPESVTDRCTKSHEYLFHLAKSERYFHDAEAIKEPTSCTAHPRGSGVNPKAKNPGVNSRIHRTRSLGAAPQSRQNESFSAAVVGLVQSRNKRSVWTVGSQPFKGAHFATFPPDLIRPCILAGSQAGDVVLDPFGGSGTTGMVALELGRRAVLIELNPEYAKLAEERCQVTRGLGL